jgi:pyruvate carboxylase
MAKSRRIVISLAAVSDLEPYWEEVRRVYAPFESGLPGPTGRVYRHEIPGGQLSNLRQQAIALGLGDQFEKVEDCYAEANRILGRPPKVTPSSKVVGDLALHLAAADENPADFEKHPEHYDIPDSVVGYVADIVNPVAEMTAFPVPMLARKVSLDGGFIRIGAELTVEELLPILNKR